MKHSEIQDSATPKNGLDDSLQTHSENKEGNEKNQQMEVESLNDNQSTSDVILPDEYDYTNELEGKLLSQENDLKNLWNLLWDEINRGERRIVKRKQY